MEAPIGTFIMYSAWAGQTALDRLAQNDPDPVNSIFTRKLLPLMHQKGLQLRDLAAEVRDQVHTLAATVPHPQTPAYYDGVLGKFCLAGCDAGRPQVAAAKGGESYVSKKSGLLPDKLTAAAIPVAEPPQAAPSPAIRDEDKSQQQVMAVAPAPAPAVAAPAGGFYCSLKSSPDEEKIQRELPSLTAKFKSVLGDVQITTKIVNLGARGVTYRAVAGPLGTKQEAMELCRKINDVAGRCCFVPN